MSRGPSASLMCVRNTTREGSADEGRRLGPATQGVRSMVNQPQQRCVRQEHRTGEQRAAVRRRSNPRSGHVARPGRKVLTTDAAAVQQDGHQQHRSSCAPLTRKPTHPPAPCALPCVAWPREAAADEEEGGGGRAWGEAPTGGTGSHVAMGTAGQAAPDGGRRDSNQHRPGSQPCGIPVAVAGDLRPSDHSAPFYRGTAVGCLAVG